MVDSISHISNKEQKHKFTIHLARHCGLPLATYCKVRHTRSDVRCTFKTFLNKAMLEFDVSAIFKSFTSLEFRLSAVVAWQELGLQYVERLLWLETFEFSHVLFLSFISNRASSVG